MYVFGHAEPILTHTNWFCRWCILMELELSKMRIAGIRWKLQKLWISERLVFRIWWEANSKETPMIFTVGWKISAWKSNGNLRILKWRYCTTKGQMLWEYSLYIALKHRPYIWWVPLIGSRVMANLFIAGWQHLVDHRWSLHTARCSIFAAIGDMASFCSYQNVWINGGFLGTRGTPKDPQSIFFHRTFRVEPSILQNHHFRKSPHLLLQPFQWRSWEILRITAYRPHLFWQHIGYLYVL